MSDHFEAIGTLVGDVVFLAFIIWGLVALERSEVAGCEYTGESTAVGTKYVVQTAYHYRCDGVDVYSGARPEATP